MKPAAPEVLSIDGVEQTRRDCENYNNCAADYHSGKAEFNILGKIYNADGVKQSLLAAQHDKCCYCESKFGATSYGDIEHHRPKGAVKEEPKHLGYWWLAYVWDNLLVSCEVCNRTHKSTWFPLRNPPARAKAPTDDIDAEEPLLINPGLQDPRNHIRFQKDAPVASDDIGQTTIKVLGLRRKDLQEARLEQFNKIKMNFGLLYVKALAAFFDQDDEVKRKSKAELDKFIEEARRADAKFSSMTQDLIDQLLKDVEVFGQTLTKSTP
jgi:uncharacterized protein (TIGR02646 family)